MALRYPFHAGYEIALLECVSWGIAGVRAGRTEPCEPLFSTARHSSVLFDTGYVIVGAELLKREPRDGNVGMKTRADPP